MSADKWLTNGSRPNAFLRRFVLPHLNGCVVDVLASRDSPLATSTRASPFNFDFLIQCRAGASRFSSLKKSEMNGGLLLTFYRTKAIVL